MIYFELDPGCRLPLHVDSAEEVVLVLDGAVVAVFGDEEVVLPRTGVVTIPEGVRHGIRNVGSTAVRAVAYFATAHPVSTFEEPVMPGGTAIRGDMR